MPGSAAPGYRRSSGACVVLPFGSEALSASKFYGVSPPFPVLLAGWQYEAIDNSTSAVSLIIVPQALHG